MTHSVPPHRKQQVARSYELTEEVRRLAKDAGMDASKWLKSPEGRKFRFALSPSDREALPVLWGASWTEAEARHEWMRQCEEHAAQRAVDERWRSARDAEKQAQAFLEDYPSPLTAPAALSMAAALAKRGKLNEANMRRAEGLYEDRVKNASPDYWPTGESVVSLLFGRDQHP